MELWHMPRCPRAARSAPLAAVLLLALAAQCGATLPSVSISPEAPTDADSLQISVGGWLMNGCWSLQGVQCGHPEDGAVGVDVFLYDAWLPGSVCTHGVLPYCCNCVCEPLTVGHYIITVTEHHESFLDPEPEIVVLEFDVVPQSAVQELSWARIRALYR